MVNNGLVGQDEDKVVSLGVEGSLYQAKLQNILTVYEHKVDASEFMFRLHERHSQVDNNSLWAPMGGKLP